MLRLVSKINVVTIKPDLDCGTTATIRGVVKYLIPLEGWNLCR